jgi:serine protease inhibitor
MRARITHLLAIISLVTVFVAGGCIITRSTENDLDIGNAGADPALAKVAPDPGVVAAANGFGINMLKDLVAEKPTENVFISPTSISMALGMTYNGAGGSTATEMADVLGITDIELDRYNQAMKTVLSNLTYGDDEVLLKIANSVWSKEGIPFEQDFLGRVQEWFGATCRTLDFSDPASVDVINGWVDDNTGGKIDKIIDRIGSDVVMYLINAVYFKGLWLHEFDKDDTKDKAFTLADGSTATVPMMYRKGEDEERFRFLDGDGFKMASLAYKDSARFVMDLVLPDVGTNLADFITGVTLKKWNTWASSLESSMDCIIEMPRLELEYDVSLVKPLERLGMPSAFEIGAADFSGMRIQKDLYISDVLHKTFLKVDEKGTEAAAVTAVEIAIWSVPRLFIIRLNRPFLMTIRDTHTGTILFMGAINNPVITSS